MFYLTGVYKDVVTTSFKFVGVLSEGPRQRYTFKGSYYRPYNVITTKYFYFKSERNFYLKSSYSAFGKSFGLTSFYYKLKKPTFFSLEGKYHIRNYDKFIFYGKYSVVRKAAYRFLSSYKVNKLSTTFLKSYYPGLKFDYVPLKGSYTQQVIKKSAVSLALIGSYDAYKPFGFRVVKPIKLQMELALNKKEGRTQLYHKLADDIFVLNTFRGTTNYKDYSTYLAGYKAMVYKDALPLYSSIITLNTPSTGSATSSVYDFVVFSAHGHIMGDFYSHRMELTVRRDIVEYQEDNTLFQTALEMSSIDFKNSFTQKFIYPNIYSVDSFPSLKIIQTPDYQVKTYLVDTIQFIFKTNAQNIKYHYTDIFYRTNAINTQVNKVEVETETSYETLFALKGHPRFYLNTYITKDFITGSKSVLNYALETIQIPIVLSNVYKDVYLLDRNLVLKPYTVVRDVYAKTTFNFKYSTHSSLLGNKFDNNLHRHYYTNKDKNIQNSFTTAYSKKIAFVNGIKSVGTFSVDKDKIRFDKVAGEYLLLRFNTNTKDFKTRLVTLSVPINTSETYLEMNYRNISYKYIQDVKELKLRYNLDINSHNVKEMLQEFILIKVRPD